MSEHVKVWASYSLLLLTPSRGKMNLELENLERAGESHILAFGIPVQYLLL